MDHPVLGTLEKDDPRSVWGNEARDFTPWLAREENLARLGGALGLEFELDATEKEVGPFRADIVCVDRNTEQTVLIENQLESTDHSHLGQILTYAAGLKAGAVVWIARRFTDEHRAAIDWLNEISSNDFNFFAVEIELWRIGDSLPAPKFNIVASPNAWEKSVRQTAGASKDLSELQRMQLEYWTAFKQYMEKHSEIRCSPPRPGTYMDHPINRSYVTLVSEASTYSYETNAFTGELRVKALFKTKRSPDIVNIVLRDREIIERELGEPVLVDNEPGRRRNRLYVRTNMNIQDRERWPRQHEWLREKLEKMHAAIYPRTAQKDINRALAEMDGASAENGEAADGEALGENGE